MLLALPMLSRVAESIYWMSRYVERAENVARFVEVNLQLMLDSPAGQDQQWAPLVATTGDLIRLPMNQPHGIFNKTDQTVKCFFWVTPTRKLYDLFWAIHSMKDQNPPEVVALSAKHEVMFLPPPPGA